MSVLGSHSTVTKRTLVTSAAGGCPGRVHVRHGATQLGDVMHVAALEMEIHIPTSDSRKAKRAVVRHIVETARRRYGVSASEVDHHDLWRRAALGFSAVAPDVPHVEQVLDRVERFVWSHPEVEVVSSSRHWLDVDR